MAKIKIKNSVTSGSVPAGLSFGEVAINIPDKKIFVGNAVESTVTLYDPNNHVLSFNGLTGAVSFSNYVASVNGVTGAITNVARTNQGNTFSVQQVMSSGITSSNLYVTSGGATFDSQVSVTTTTNAIDVVATTDGTGLRIAQATSGSSARVGGIRLGRSTVVGSNVYLEGYVGTFRVYNGISGTVASTGTKMLELSTSGGAIFDIPIAGATFSSSLGRITVQKSAYVGSDSGTVRIIGADALSTQYNSDIRANASAAADTTHTLPAVTGTLLNTASSYVSGICGATGNIVFVAGSNMTITRSGNTFTFASTASGGSGGGGAGFTYAASAPGSPSIGDRWIDSDTGKEYVYVSDGSSSQWIEPVSSNGLDGLTYTLASKLYEFGGTGSFVKLGVGTTAPAYTLHVVGDSNFTSGISAASIRLSGGVSGVTASFSGSVSTNSGYQITSSVINALTGTTYALLSTDNGKIITWNNNTQGVTLTVPSGLPVGFNTTIIQIGTGSVGITGSGVTLNSFEGKLRIVGQHGAVSIISYASNVFNVAGGLTG